MNGYLQGAAVAVTVVSLAAGLAACEKVDSTAPRRDSGKIGLLLPDIQADRYERFDRPLIEKKVKELCGECTVEYANAKGDAATQKQQVDSMITRGVRVLVISILNSTALRSSIEEAKNAGVPVVAYDRLADGPISALVAYDPVEVGRIQSETLLKALGPTTHGAQIIMLDTPADTQGTVLRGQGSLSALKGKVRAVRTYTIGVLSAEEAYTSMSTAIADLGADNINGVVASNDIIAGGVIAALKAAHIHPLPPVTGQDADLEAVQRIVEGDQYMTVYKPYKPEADAAAETAVALARGERIDDIAKDRVNSSTAKDIPAVLLNPTPLTVGKIKDTVVKDGVFTLDQICTRKFASGCAKAGLTG